MAKSANRSRGVEEKRVSGYTYNSLGDINGWKSRREEEEIL